MSVATLLRPNTAAGDPATADTEEARVVAKAVTRAASLLGLSNAELSRTLGLSEASASRLRAGGYAPAPSSKPFELAVLLLRLFRGLDAIMGGDATAIRAWMRAPNTALRDRPLALIQTVQGLVQTVQYVDSRRARI